MPEKKSKRSAKPRRKAKVTSAKRKRAPAKKAARKKKPARPAPPLQPESPEPEREREEPERLIPGAADDDLAEELGEESVEAATSGQTTAEDNLNQEVPEETGGPFVETSGKTVLGYGSRARKK